MGKIFSVILLLVIMCSCSNDSNNNDEQASACDRFVEISDSKFDVASVDDFQITAASINGDCLSLQISYEGGCNEPGLQLIGNTIVDAGPPVERTLRLKVDTKGDTCTDASMVDLTFDLTPLKLPLEDQIAVKIKGWDQPLIFNN